MKLFLMLFLKLYIFRLSHCDRKCFDEPETIYLLDTNRHTTLNYLFKRNVQNIMNAKVEFINVDGMSLKDALDSIPSQPDTVAIHLYATDFYQHNYDEIQQHNFKYAGDIENIDTRSLRENGECYIITFETDNTTQLNEIAHNKVKLKSRCEINEKPTKLVSKSIDNYPRLLAFVTNFESNNQDIDHYVEAEKICQPILIVICKDHRHVNEITTEYIMKKKIRIDVTNSCELYNFHKSERVIVVLAPKPFALQGKLDNLMLFYDHLDTGETPATTDTFTNGFTLIQSQADMRNAFLKIMQMMEWKRVAIISDDSIFSQEFEQELTTYFEKENVIYISKSCVDPNCNYTEALRPIMTAEPRIVIANVVEKNAEKFVFQASQGMLLSIVWLVRDWSPNVVRDAALKLGDVISVTLGHEPPEVSKYYEPQCTYNPCNLEKLLSIIEDLDTDDYQTIRRLESLPKREMTEYLKNKLLEDDNVIAYANWYRQNYYGQINIIATTKIYLSSLENKYLWYPEAPQIRSELRYCTFKSGVYLHPCYDVELTLIMLVLSVFALTILGVIYFFQMPEESYSRMAH